MNIVSIPNRFEQPYGSNVNRVEGQCGMNFVVNLYLSNTIKDIIGTLDYAFNHWGAGKWCELHWKEGMVDPKSQVFFTDVENSKHWIEIKKLATKGPVTVNERDFAKNKICVYILTRNDYYDWRDKWVAENPEDAPSPLKPIIEPREDLNKNDLRVEELNPTETQVRNNRRAVYNDMVRYRLP